jgi:two-component system, NarL family, nitrate/nitrite response regulator NarL
MPNVRLLLRAPLIRDALSALLTEAGFSVSREAGPADDDTAVIVDFDDCLDPEQIRAYRRYGAKVIALAREADGPTLSDDHIVPLDGLLTDALSGEAWVRSLNLICAGERVFPGSPALGQDRPACRSGLQGAGERLSSREMEVLLLVAKCRSNEVIARHLRISEATVKVHLESLQRKIRVDNRTQAVIWALAQWPGLAAHVAAA